MTTRLQLDLTGPEFAVTPDPRLWTHTQPDFRAHLRSLNYHREWHQLLRGIHTRYQLAPRRPHTVYEAFLRGDYGYVPMIIAVQSPAGRAQVRGLLYRCTMAPGVSGDRKLHALYELAASAI